MKGADLSNDSSIQAAARLDTLTCCRMELVIQYLLCVKWPPCQIEFATQPIYISLKALAADVQVHVHVTWIA